MIVFDAEEEDRSIEVNLPGGRRKIYEVTLVDRRTLKRLNSMERERKEAGEDMEKQFDLIYEQLQILAPEIKESDLKGVSITKLAALAAEMTRIAFGVQRTDEVKKNPDTIKPRSSRSRRRASA